MNNSTRVNRHSKPITLGEYRKSQEKTQEEHYILGPTQEDDEFIAEYGWWEYGRLYDDLTSWK